jgi:hypothetical protein
LISSGSAGQASTTAANSESCRTASDTASPGIVDCGRSLATKELASTVSNPFSTRFTRPGQIPFCFPEGVDLPQLIEKLARQGWRGQIIGPHGSGKSTLLAMLVPSIEAAGRSVVALTLHDGCRRLPIAMCDFPAHNGLLVVDGYEQLGRLQRVWTQFCCWRRGAGLLVTGHDDVGLPTLVETTSTLALAEGLFARLVPEGDGRVALADLKTAFRARRGDLRETFLDLYDLYESRRAEAGVWPRLEGRTDQS